MGIGGLNERSRIGGKGMSKYRIWLINDIGKAGYCAKEYPYKLQAYIWCWLNGFVVNMGRYGYRLDGRVIIEEIKNENN